MTDQSAKDAAREKAWKRKLQKLQSQVDTVKRTFARHDRKMAGLVDAKKKTAQLRLIAAPITKGDDSHLALYAPHEKTVINLGHASKDDHADHGIFMGTDRHIHIEAKQGDETRTSLTLGTSTDKIYSTHSDKWGATVTGSKGFMMITQGESWLSSKGSMKLHAHEGELTLDTAGSKGQIVLLAPFAPIRQVAKSVQVDAHENVEIRAAFAEGWDAIAYGVNTKAIVGAVAASKVVAWATTGAGWLLSLAGIAKKTFTTPKAPEWAKPTLVEGKRWPAVLSGAVDVVKLLLDMKKALFKDKDKKGRVDVNAATDATLTGKYSATVWGGTSASLSSPKAVGVTGTTASMLGLMSAGVSAGMEVSISSLKNVTMSAEHGQLSVAAKKDVHISSGSEHLIATGVKGAQLTSPEHTIVHGGSKSSFTCGSDLLFGMHATTKQAAFGHIYGNANKLADCTWKMDNGVGLLAKESEMRVQCGRDNSISIKDGNIEMVAEGSVTVKARGVTYFKTKSNKLFIM